MPGCEFARASRGVWERRVARGAMVGNTWTIATACVPHRLVSGGPFVVPLLALFGVSLLGVMQVRGEEVARLRALIVDGQNNHDWRATTPMLKAALEESGRFQVEVATSPPAGADMSDFAPKFSNYDVIVSNYNGEPWSQETRNDFEHFIREGGGLVVVHAADNAFADWPAYNQMIGLGGWNDRDEASGPYVYFNAEERPVRDTAAGPGGGHGEQHEFVVVVRDADHPITRGLPTAWLHTKDELYQTLRGPAERMRVLATAFAAPSYGGTGRHEPMLMAIEFGKGRVFHTTLGHATYSMDCVGFVATLQRGAEWAATGDVTISIPSNFPSVKQSRPWLLDSAEQP